MTTTEQARADAMADAETLRRVLNDEADYIETAERRQRILRRLEALESANLRKRGGGYGSFMSEHRTGRWFRTGQMAEEAARAAFRAVPGLRGDR
jgi:hypothetical protein